MCMNERIEYITCTISKYQYHQQERKLSRRNYNAKM